MSTSNNNRQPPGDDKDDNRDKKPNGGGKISPSDGPSSPSSSSVPPNVGRFEPASPYAEGTVTTCNSSVGDDASNMNIVGTNNAHSGQHHQQQRGDIVFAPSRTARSTVFRSTGPERRHQLQREMFQLAVVTTASFAALIVTIVPMSVLALFGASGGLFLALLYKVYQRILLEYQEHILNGQGLAPYLPESIRRQLVDTSLHEYMSDDAFGKEYGYLLLYFIPGIGPLEPYLNRLVPRHQQLLQRRGLGHVFGPAFMRWIVGDAGVRDVARRPGVTSEARLLESSDGNETPDNSTLASLPSTSAAANGVARIDNDDDDMAERDYWISAGSGNVLGTASDLDEHSPADAYARFMGMAIPGDEDISLESDKKPAAKDTTKDEDDDNSLVDNSIVAKKSADEAEEDLGSEFNVLYDACVNCVTAYSMAAYEVTRDTVSSVTGSSLYSLTQNVRRASSAIAVVSLSVGLWGWYAGVYDRPSPSAVMLPRMQFSMPSIRFPSSSMLWSTAMTSGVTSLGLTLYMLVWPGSSSSSSADSSKRSDGGKEKQKDP